MASASLLALLFGVADGLPTFPLLGVFLTGRDSGSESDDELEEEVSSGLGDLLGGDGTGASVSASVAIAAPASSCSTVRLLI